MTATSAGNGTSAGNSGEWGWFTPASGTSEDPPRERPESRSPRECGPRHTHQPAPPEPPAAESPSRPVPAVRPVGPGAAGVDVGNRPSGSQPDPEPEPEPVHERAPGLAQLSAGPNAALTPALTPALAPPAPFAAAGPSPAAEPGGGAAAPPEAVEPSIGDLELAGLSPDAVRLRRTMAELEPVADQATAYFYATLFLHHPHLRELFPAAMNQQRDRLFKALITSAKLIDDDELLEKYLGNLGRGHRKYGTRSEHYPAVGESLMDALARYAPRSWSRETEDAWVRAYTKMSQIMIDAAAEHEQYAPAWWEAEVVSHQQRTSDIAVITVRPDAPYPFVAGQYTSIETRWWPRVWRHYSFASAARSDGLLSFHVKAVPAGWVSNALVHRARPGDVLRLGPPAGSMTVDHGTDNGLLCLGGSTGIAPIKALVEEVAEYGRRRRVEVFYGARSGRDLYDIDTMQRLERLHPWLSVRPVVSEGPTEGLVGDLPDAVRQYGPWSEFVGYLSGPPGMIRSGVDALRGVGIPAHRIRHDAVEELAIAGD